MISLRIHTASAFIGDAVCADGRMAGVAFPVNPQRVPFACLHDIHVSHLGRRAGRQLLTSALQRPSASRVLQSRAPLVLRNEARSNTDVHCRGATATAGCALLHDTERWAVALSYADALRRLHGLRWRWCCGRAGGARPSGMLSSTCTSKYDPLPRWRGLDRSVSDEHASHLPPLDLTCICENHACSRKHHR